MTNKDIKNAYVGTTSVKAMYLGSTKVWPVETLSRPQYGASNNVALNWSNGTYFGPGKDDKSCRVLSFALLPFKERII